MESTIVFCCGALSLPSLSLFTHFIKKEEKARRRARRAAAVDAPRESSSTTLDSAKETPTPRIAGARLAPKGVNLNSKRTRREGRHSNKKAKEKGRGENSVAAHAHDIPRTIGIDVGDK